MSADLLQALGIYFWGEELGVAQGVEEAVTEEFNGGSQVFGGHAVEAAVGYKESVGGEDVEVGVEDEVVAEGMDGANATMGEAETDAEGILVGGGGVVEKEGEEVAAFAEDAAQDLGDGEPYFLAMSLQYRSAGFRWILSKRCACYEIQLVGLSRFCSW